MAEQNPNLQRPSFQSPERFFDVGFKDVELGDEDQNKPQIDIRAESTLLSVPISSGVQTFGITGGKSITIDYDLISGKLNTNFIPMPQSSTSTGLAGQGTTPVPSMDVEIAKQIKELKDQIQKLKINTTQSLKEVDSNLTTGLQSLIRNQGQNFSEEFEIVKSGSKYFFDLRLVQAGDTPTWL